MHECTDDYFPHQLQSLTESLLEAIESFKELNDGKLNNTEFWNYLHPEITFKTYNGFNDGSALKQIFAPM